MRPVLAYRKPAAPPIEECSDLELLRQLREGSEDALDELVRRKTGPLLQVARRIVRDTEEARDVVQMTFVRVWESRDRFDERWSPNTWIYRIATNLAIDLLRSRQSRDRQREPLKLDLAQKQEGSVRRLLGDLRAKEVRHLFDQLAADLTERQRAVFVLREIEGMTSSEVAEIVGCRESTVRNHLFNARRVLQAAVLEKYPEYAPSGAGDAS